MGLGDGHGWPQSLAHVPLAQVGGSTARSPPTLRCRGLLRHAALGLQALGMEQEKPGCTVVPKAQGPAPGLAGKVEGLEQWPRRDRRLQEDSERGQSRYTG